MERYWPSLFFSACLWTESESRSMKQAKKNEANIQPFDRTSLVNKGLIIWKTRPHFRAGHSRYNPERAR